MCRNLAKLFWLPHLLVLMSFSTTLTTKVHAETLLESTSRNGKQMTMKFSDSPVSTLTTQGRICTTPGAQLAKVELWMPEHGHGSTPTSLGSFDGQCTDVNDINFVMPGRWEIIVDFSDSDRGVFKVEVEP